MLNKIKNQINNKINIGIIGSNFASNVHLPAFRLNADCNVIGISANNLEKTKLIAEKNNIPKVYNTWEQMILDSDIDAISIAVPPWLQPNIILAALEQKKAVFAEKPLAINLLDATKITELANNKNLANIINFSFAGSNAFIKAKNILSNNNLFIEQNNTINQNKINQIRYININWQLETKTSLEKNSNHWKTQSNLGGGVLFNFASHVLFYLEWLLHPAYIEIPSIVVKQSNLLGNNLGSNLIRLSASLSTGAAINILISTAAFMGSGHKIEIYGDNNSMVLENKPNNPIGSFTLKIADRNLNAWKRISVKNDSIKNNNINLNKILDDRVLVTHNLVNKFIDWIKTGNIQHPNFMDGLRVNVILDKIIPIEGVQ